MFLPYTNVKNETRLHAIFCIININNKYAFARTLPFTATRGGRDKEYDPSEPLDENGEQGGNINGERYEVKIKGQAYSQAKVIGALGAIFGHRCTTRNGMVGNQNTPRSEWGNPG